MRVHAHTVGVTLLTLCGIAAPAGATEDEGKILLRNFVTDVRTLSASFEQSLLDADGVLVEESDGTLEIQRPGRFRWSYASPYEQITVADGLNVWSYDVDLAQVTVKSQREVLGGTPALLLGGTGNVLDDFEYVASNSDRGTVWVELRPRSSDNGFTKIELGFNDGDLRRMIFSDNLQQSTLIVLFDLQLNQDISAERFRFTPPADADLVGKPIVADGSGH